MKIEVKQRGSFHNTERYLRRLSQVELTEVLSRYGARGVDALRQATPIESGLTAQSWYYEIVTRPGYYSIRWRNANIQNGTLIVALLEYGHATRNGGYVPGREFIMTAITPIFEAIQQEAREEVTRL